MLVNITNNLWLDLCEVVAVCPTEGGEEFHVYIRSLPDPFVFSTELEIKMLLEKLEWFQREQMKYGFVDHKRRL